MKSVPALAAFLLSAALVTFAAPAVAAPKIGQPPPPLVLPALDGKTIDLASFKGHGVYVNFFALWCGPCNEEAPTIAKLATKYAKFGIRTLGVNELNSKEDAITFQREYKLPYTIVVDPDKRLVGPYAVIGMPVHVFVKKDGNVSYFRLGEMSPAEIEEQYRALK